MPTNRFDGSVVVLAERELQVVGLELDGPATAENIRKALIKESFYDIIDEEELDVRAVIRFDLEASDAES